MDCGAVSAVDALMHGQSVSDFALTRPPAGVIDSCSGVVAFPNAA